MVKHRLKSHTVHIHDDGFDMGDFGHPWATKNGKIFLKQIFLINFLRQILRPFNNCTIRCHPGTVADLDK